VSFGRRQIRDGEQIQCVPRLLDLPPSHGWENRIYAGFTDINRLVGIARTQLVSDAKPCRDECLHGPCGQVLARTEDGP
jgi:hypothetical protein